MKERPILFSGPMVRAILDGRKTMTRRVIKNVPPDCNYVLEACDNSGEYKFFSRLSYGSMLARTKWFKCPYGKPGDRLWVRESFHLCGTPIEGKPHTEWVYRADCSVNGGMVCPACEKPVKWKPSIHMSRHASRIALEITDIRVERLQEITEEDALAEGVNKLSPCPQRAFLTLWDSINGKKPGRSWADNPWVWAISFRRIQ